MRKEGPREVEQDPLMIMTREKERETKETKERSIPYSSSFHSTKLKT